MHAEDDDGLLLLWKSMRCRLFHACEMEKKHAGVWALACPTGGDGVFGRGKMVMCRLCMGNEGHATLPSRGHSWKRKKPAGAHAWLEGRPR